MKPDVGIVGMGAFGQLMAHHLAPHFRIHACDKHVAPEALAHRLPILPSSLPGVASRGIVIIAIPVQAFPELLPELAGLVQPGTLIIDVSSVKVIPVRCFNEHFGDGVDIVATHPLFGPQSARNGIAGKKITISNVRGNSLWKVAAFLRSALKLDVLFVDPEEHDRQMAMVQGLTHLIAKIMVRMDPPPLTLTTETYTLLDRLVGTVRYDSDALFHTIEALNPFIDDVKSRFFSTARKLEVELHEKGAASAHAELAPLRRLVNRL